DLAMSVGNSVGSLYRDIVLGYDTRASNVMMSNAVLSGALLSGAGIHMAGMVSTPTLATAAGRFNCGIMITASHNPPEYSGIKLWNHDGSAFDTSQMEKVEDSVLKRKYKKVAWKDIVPVSRYDGAIKEHMEKVLDSISESKVKVVVDCMNGAASVVTPYLLKRMGCEVIAINSRPDGSFLGRTPEPTEENLEHLKSYVRAVRADLGIAHDGDGDRMVAVDEKGNYVSGDKLLSLFCGFEAIKSVVVPFNASMVIEEQLRNIRIHRCKVGDVFVVETIKRTGADFGGEPSGTYIFPKHSLCPDGIYAAARLVEIVKKSRLSRLIGRMPSYPTIRS
ncbi:MAG: phosphoglucosamine mutase, partial [Thermoplasmata archaeon]|nr:phosphoglucosamine mutase [Thermoplasmata archaeon]